jgi:hypothetical protein
MKVTPLSLYREAVLKMPGWFSAEDFCKATRGLGEPELHYSRYRAAIYQQLRAGKLVALRSDGMKFQGQFYRVNK